jgi:hypothetical protein
MVTVKSAKTRKRKGGRPLGDPEDKRTERIAIRAHPDLVDELSVVARAQGFVRSVLIERTLIDVVNRYHGRPVVDAIGRHIQQLDRVSTPVTVPGGGPSDHPGRRLRPTKK